MDKGTCSVDGCEKSLRSSTFCYAHYMKNWRYGTPTPTHPSRVRNAPGDRIGTLTLIERIGQQWRCECECGRIRLSRSGDLNRAGDASTCGYRPNHRIESPSYGAAHDRIRRDRGSASLHRCVDCDSQAHHWSYDHAADDEMHEMIGNSLVAYSPSQDHYLPRCVPCHKRFDLDRIDAA